MAYAVICRSIEVPSFETSFNLEYIQLFENDFEFISMFLSQFCFNQKIVDNIYEVLYKNF